MQHKRSTLLIYSPLCNITHIYMYVHVHVDTYISLYNGTSFQGHLYARSQVSDLTHLGLRQEDTSIMRTPSSLASQRYPHWGGSNGHRFALTLR